MQEDIDIQTYAGDLGQAAADQVVDTNSYLQEVSEEFLPTPAMDDQPETQVDRQPSKQELNFRALTQEVDRLKAERESERKLFQDQLDMLRANMGQQPQAPQPQPRKMFDGMRDDDVPSVAELRREWEVREAGYQARLEEMEVAHRYPDYAEVIEKFALPLVKEKPHLAQGIQGATNKALFAYELGKMAQQLQGSQVSNQRSETAQRIVENARKPGTLSSAGGQSVLSKADYYATMSDSEFLKMASRNLDQI